MVSTKRHKLNAKLTNEIGRVNEPLSVWCLWLAKLIGKSFLVKIAQKYVERKKEEREGENCDGGGGGGG
jgi:hypothetical protein